MKKLKPLFGFECKYDDDGLIEIKDVCEYPQLHPNALKLHRHLEQVKINDSKIEFPVRIIHFTDTKTPKDLYTIKTYYNIEGILRIVEENKSRLIGKTTFIKPEIQYPKKSKYPNLHIHFYQLSQEEGSMYIIDDFDLIESCSIFYENTNQFTEKRIADLGRYVDTSELRQIPFLPMELVRFDYENNSVLPFESHLLAFKASELPF